MSSRKRRNINMPAPYLKRLWLDLERVPNPDAYPFCLPFLRDGFELSFDRAITIIVGENGTGKSTLLEGNRHCWRGSRCWPVTTRPAVAKAI
jgi:hypothetical protein